MVKTVLSIDGMMCSMCEAHINDVVRKVVPDAKKVKSSHRKGECTFLSEAAPDADQLRAAIAQTGYELRAVSSEETGRKR